MSIPDYGRLHTVCRPMLANMSKAAAPSGAVLVRCEWCGCDCWKMPAEPDPLPAGWAAACTACALRRKSRQREMDAKRAKREAAARAAGVSHHLPGGRDAD